MDVTIEGVKRRVTQLHFVGWPDRGPPPPRLSLLPHHLLFPCWLPSPVSLCLLLPFHCFTFHLCSLLPASLSALYLFLLMCRRSGLPRALAQPRDGGRRSLPHGAWRAHSRPLLCGRGSHWFSPKSPQLTPQAPSVSPWLPCAAWPAGRAAGTTSRGASWTCARPAATWCRPSTSFASASLSCATRPKSSYACTMFSSYLFQLCSFCARHFLQHPSHLPPPFPLLFLSPSLPNTGPCGAAAAI